MHVFLNPGHSPDGRPDCGAVNFDAGLAEWEKNLEICRQVKVFLENAGCRVTMVQSHNLAEESPEYGESVTTQANRLGADILVSVHCNAASGRARGCETFCFERGTDGEVLAECIQSRLHGAMSILDEGFPNRGVKENSTLLVLKYSAMPAVLVETAFIDNVEDAALLIMYHHQMARAIAVGITDYWQKTA